MQIAHLLMIKKKKTPNYLLAPSSLLPPPSSLFPPLVFLKKQKKKRKVQVPEIKKRKGAAKMMMLGKEDLGLSLSLSSSAAHHRHLPPPPPPLQLHLMPSSCLPSSNPWAAAESREMPMPMPMPMLRGIDVNRAPPSSSGVGSEEDGGASSSSPNSTLSSVSGKRAERDEEIDPDRGCGSGGGGGTISDEEDGGDGSRKKLRLSKEQSAVLEESFKEHNTLNPKQKLALAKQLSLRPRQVEVWFQNRRARTKLKQTEVDCEFLRRCCETLTEENRRLQREVQELRALKMSPQFYMHMTPPTTLTMCPSCERVSNSAASAAASPEQHQFLQHRPASQAPWAPVPLRPFLDAPRQRS